MKKSWTLDKIAAEAKKYSSRGEFKREAKEAYDAAVRNRILSDICVHMPLTRYSVKAIKAEAAKYDTRADFKAGSLGAYDAAVRRKILDDVCNHMTTKHRKWTMEVLRKEASKYQTNADFKAGSPAAFSTAYRWGVMNEICQHMDAAQESWPVNRIVEEALKYSTRTEFRQGNPKAYDAAKRRKVVDQVCAHMSVLTKSYTNEEIADEAAMYRTRARFFEGLQGAYQAALRRGLMEEVCAHMEKGSGSDGDAVYFWQALLPNGKPLTVNGVQVYKLGVTSQRLLDRRINHVAKKNGLKVGKKMIAYYDEAYHIERIVLALTEPVAMGKKDGATEFRALKAEDMIRVVCIFAGAHLRSIDDPANLPGLDTLIADGARDLAPKMAHGLISERARNNDDVMFKQQMYKKGLNWVASKK
jgi:hypothetical protein